MQEAGLAATCGINRYAPSATAVRLLFKVQSVRVIFGLIVAILRSCRAQSVLVKGSRFMNGTRQPG
jgi:hypothetical protein